MKKIILKYITVTLFMLFYYAIIRFFNNTIVNLISTAIICLFITLITCAKSDKYNCIKSEHDIYELIHDLKTPALAQLRVTDHMVNGSFGSLNDSQKEIAIQLNNSARYMSDMINNFLQLCRVKHNNLALEMESFDINDVIKQCIADLKYISADKRCTILFDYSDEQIFVNGAKTELRRVIMNILTNAVNYSYPDRIITTTSRIQNNKYCFDVNSFGDYIEKEQLKSICNEYKSLKKSGTGLGLYICEIILNKHNSNITVKSDKKTGNSFGFELSLEKFLPVNSTRQIPNKKELTA